jgi:hypothetical protein
MRTPPATLALCSLLASTARAEEPAPAPAPDDKAAIEPPRISGYLQTFFKHRIDDGDDGDGVEPSLFRIGRARLKVDGDVSRWVSYTLEVDPRAPAITGVMRDAYLELHVVPRHRIRLGQQKTQFGWENRQSSSELYTVTRAEISEGPARGVTLRDIGVGLIGRVPLGGGFALEDAITVVNGAGMNVQADDTDTKNVWGRIGGRYRPRRGGPTVWLGLSAGIGDFVEPADPQTGDPAFVVEFRRFGADLEVDAAWFFLAAEAVTSHDTSPDNPDAEADYLGYSVLAAGKTPWDVGPVARYDVLDLEEFSRWTFGVYWGGPKKAVRAMTTYEIFEDEAGPHDHRWFLWAQVRFGR